MAIAAIPSTTNGQITACVDSTTRAVRIIDSQAGARCRSGEQRISWSKGYRYRGNWSNRTAYSVQDVVVAGGSSYVAKAPSTGKAPASNPGVWGLLAAHGATGPSNAYAMYHDANINLTETPDSNVTLGTLSVPAGNYFATAKVVVYNNDTTSERVDCTLYAGGNNDRSYVAAAPPANSSIITLEVVTTFSTAGQFGLNCTAEPGLIVQMAKAIAIKVGNVSNVGF